MKLNDAFTALDQACTSREAAAALDSLRLHVKLLAEGREVCAEDAVEARAELDGLRYQLEVLPRPRTMAADFIEVSSSSPGRQIVASL